MTNIKTKEIMQSERQKHHRRYDQDYYPALTKHYYACGPMQFSPKRFDVLLLIIPLNIHKQLISTTTFFLAV